MDSCGIWKLCLTRLDSHIPITVLVVRFDLLVAASNIIVDTETPTISKREIHIALEDH